MSQYVKNRETGVVFPRIPLHQGLAHLVPCNKDGSEIVEPVVVPNTNADGSPKQVVPPAAQKTVEPPAPISTPPPDDPPKPIDPATMTRQELVDYLKANNVTFRSNMGETKLRDLVVSHIADAAPKGDGDTQPTE